MASLKIAIPGQLLGSITDHIAGPGTHIYESKIYASILGPVNTETEKKTPKVTLSVARNNQSAASPSAKDTSTVLPIVGSTVLCTVTRVQVRQASCLILAVMPSASSTNRTSPIFPPSEPLNFQALLRREDIRLTEKDRVIMNESVRVGDVIRAQVISIGDERQYYVSTAGNEFGVMAARGEGNGVYEGEWMTPVSWKEMRDLDADGPRGEGRKVAKPSFG